MEIETIFNTGNVIAYIECDENLLHAQCHECKGYGTIKVQSIYIDNAEEFLKNPGRQQNTCPRCKGVGKIPKITRTSDWRVSDIFRVDSVRGSIKNGEFKAEEVLCDIRYEKNADGILVEEDVAESFPPEDCFPDVDVAAKACDIRNNIVLFSVDLADVTFLFECMDDVLLKLRNFMINSISKYTKSDLFIVDEDVKGNQAASRFLSIQDAAIDQGINMKIIKMSLLDYEKVPSFGGIKVSRGMPELANVLYFEKEIESKTREEYLEK